MRSLSGAEERTAATKLPTTAADALPAHLFRIGDRTDADPRERPMY
jgi:hypothetical protein